MPTSAPPVRPEDEDTGGPSKSSSHATIALVLALLGIFMFGIILGSIAIFMGVHARREIDDSNGQLTGRGRATAAIFIGIGAVVVWLAVVVGAMAGS